MKFEFYKWHVFFIYVLLALVTIVAFGPVRHNEFVNYDDYEYVTKNPQVKSGINRESVIWAFTTWHSANWHPLTWLSHMLDCELFGLNSFFHHLTNLLFHVINTLLLFWILKRMTSSVWPSAFVAAAFALHPLHVESVAWVAERKDVLSGFFWMLTIAAYIRYTERPRIERYLMVVLALSLGLMAKPMLVTLPFVLLLLDYWPLGRFRWEQGAGEEDLPQLNSVSAGRCSPSNWHLIVEKIPLFILVVISCVITFVVQKTAGAMEQEDLPLNVRIAVAIISYARYIGMVIYPRGLAVLYPLPVESLPAWQPIVSLIILICISMVVFYGARRYRYLAVGWLWYLGTLVPVIGLVRVGSQAMADRYTYLPAIGIFIMVAWGATEFLNRWLYKKVTLGITASVAIVVLLICTRIQVGYWRDSLTLFRHTLEVTKKNYVIHKNYANALYERGRLDEAVKHYKESLRIAPLYLRPRLTMGTVFLEQGRFEEAAECFNELLQIKPDHAEAHYYLAISIAEQGKSEGVLEHFMKALRSRSDWAEAYFNLSWFYARQGKYELAIETAERAKSLAEEAGQKDLVGEIVKRLQRYKSKQPFIKKSSGTGNIVP